MVDERQARRQARAKERRAAVQLPWEDEGWFADSRKAAEDPVIERVVDEVQGSGIDPRGYRERRSGAAWTPVMHNPYPSLILAAGSVWAGFIVLGFHGTGDAWSWFFAGLVWFTALVVAVVTMWRIPKWHRARAAVRRHIAAHGGEMPDDLKWYR